MSVLSVVGSFVRRLRLSSMIARLRGVTGGSLHRLFKLDIRLGSGKNLAHLGGVVLQEVFVYGVSNMQPADKCEGDNFLLTVRDFSELVLKEIDV